MSMKVTMAEFVGLEPCPFCGGEASIVDHHNDDGSVSVGCANDTCLGFSGLGWLFRTEAEAIEAWNTRKEQTCENITDNKRANQFECSKCHCIVEDAENYYVNVYERGKLFKGNTYGWDYCPNCGAKVIA